MPNTPRGLNPFNAVPAGVVAIFVTAHLLTRVVWRKMDGLPEMISFLLGVAPNFFAAVTLPSALLLWPSRVQRRKVVRQFAVLTSLVLAWLVLEELHPVVSASKVFDPYDIAASVVGIAMASALFAFLLPRLSFAESLPSRDKVSR